jgi:hypothetical protein
MGVERAGGVLAIAAALGCTVGGGSSSTLSGGASGSAGDDGGEAASSDDGASEGTDADASGDAGDPSSADDGDDDADASSDDADSSSDGAGSSDGGDTTASIDDGSSSGGDDDLADGILDITIISHDDCTFTTMPASISVPEGTEFTVNWISSGASEVEFDVAKIDQFNAVPIILGMEPATSYHDEVRVWCGDLFTGTFDFSLTSCFDPQYIPVDCSA